MSFYIAGELCIIQLYLDGCIYARCAGDIHLQSANVIGKSIEFPKITCSRKDFMAFEVKSATQLVPYSPLTTASD